MCAAVALARAVLDASTLLFVLTIPNSWLSFSVCSACSALRASFVACSDFIVAVALSVAAWAMSV